MWQRSIRKLRDESTWQFYPRHSPHFLHKLATLSEWCECDDRKLKHQITWRRTGRSQWCRWRENRRRRRRRRCSRRPKCSRRSRRRNPKVSKRRWRWRCGWELFTSTAPWCSSHSSSSLSPKHSCSFLSLSLCELS